MKNDKEKFIKNNEIDNIEFDLICKYSKIRYESNISQRELANKTGLAQSTIARIEKNIHSTTLPVFIKILKALGYHLEIKKD